MAKLPLFLTTVMFLLFMNILSQPASGFRTLGRPHNHHHHHHNHHKFAFAMRDVLNVTQPSASKVTGATNQLIPFPKPIGLFPPNDGIPIPESNPPRFPSQTIDIPNSLELFFPARAALEFGALMTIYEDLFNGSFDGSLLGKAQGFCVASSEDGSSHMISLNTFFANGEPRITDGLRLFGVHRNDVPESHVSVIGGTGKYAGANGYATVKALHVSTEEQELNKLLLFNVYLS